MSVDVGFVGPSVCSCNMLRVFGGTLEFSLCYQEY